MKRPYWIQACQTACFWLLVRLSARSEALSENALGTNYTHKHGVQEKRQRASLPYSTGTVMPFISLWVKWKTVLHISPSLLSYIHLQHSSCSLNNDQNVFLNTLLGLRTSAYCSRLRSKLQQLVNIGCFAMVTQKPQSPPLSKD